MSPCPGSPRAGHGGTGHLELLGGLLMEQGKAPCPQITQDPSVPSRPHQEKVSTPNPCWKGGGREHPLRRCHRKPSSLGAQRGEKSQ